MATRSINGWVKLQNPQQTPEKIVAGFFQTQHHLCSMKEPLGGAAGKPGGRDLGWPDHPEMMAIYVARREPTI